jgi:cysteinyl-tRNA synthetase
MKTVVNTSKKGQKLKKNHYFYNRQYWRDFKNRISDSLNNDFNKNNHIKTLSKLCQKHPKNCNMKIKKPLSEPQKRSLSNAITALSTPIFSTYTKKSHLQRVVSGFFCF